MSGRHFGGAPVLLPKPRLGAQNLANYVLPLTCQQLLLILTALFVLSQLRATSGIAPPWERCFCMECRDQRRRTA